MSSATPFAVMAVAIFGAYAVALLEQAVAGQRPAPAAILRRAVAVVGQPLTTPARPVYVSVCDRCSPGSTVSTAPSGALA